mgnify:CR=1 FL=1
MAAGAHERLVGWRSRGRDCACAPEVEGANYLVDVLRACMYIRAMFEPCHGSAPDIAGKNLANPLAMISSLSMALRYSLNEEHISDKIDQATKKFIQAGYRTIDISIDDDYLMTSDVAEKIIKIIKNDQ